MTTEAGEREVIELVAPRYQAEGYDVYVDPSPSILPSFMASYRPDAIALKPGKKVAIEVVLGTPNANQTEAQLQSLFAGQGEWEFTVIYAPPLISGDDLPIASAPLIVDTIQRVEELRSEGSRLAALVMAWATFEAIGRALLPERLSRPQPPARLVEVLASEGYVTPDEADVLRRASVLRDAIVHGGLDSVVDDDLLAELVAILTTLVNLEPSEAKVYPAAP